MKKDIAVFCVCRNEPELLPLWFKYYSNLVSPENVFVFDDNSTVKYDIDFVNYEMLDLGRDPNIQRYGAHDYNTLWGFIVEKYHELLQTYKWVIHVDADDFLVLNPELNFKGFILSGNRSHFRCKAYEVLHELEEPALDWTKNILKQRKKWIRVTNLDKTCVVSMPLDFRGPGSWILGNHYACGSVNEPANDNLLLVHLHRIDYDTCRNKYLVIDDRITDDKSFNSLYGGAPLFWQENVFNEYFYQSNSNRQWGAKLSSPELIPNMYKGVF